MEKSIRQLVIGSSYSLLALIAVKITDVVSSIIVSRLLGPKNLGMFAIIKYLLDLLCIFTVLGIPTAMVKFIAESKFNPHAMRVSSTSFVSMLIPTLGVCAVIFYVSDYIAQNIYHEPSLGFLIKISVLTLFAMSLFAFYSSILQGLQKIKELSLTRIINSIAGLPVVVFLVYYGGLKGAVVSKAVVALIGIGIAGWIIGKIWADERWKVSFAIDYSFIKKLLNLAFPAFLSGVVMVPALWIVTTQLSITQGFAEVGLFNVAYSLIQIILFIPMAVGIPLVPKIAELHQVNLSSHWTKVNQNDVLPNKPNELNEQGVPTKAEFRSVISNSLYLVGVISLTVAMVFSIFSKNILSLLYGAEYLPAWSTLILLSASSFLASIGYIIGYYLLGIGKMWIGVIFNLIWFVSLISASIPLASLYGAKGLGIAYISSYIIVTLVMLSFIKKIFGLPIVHLSKLMISGLLFACLSYLFINYLQSGAFLGSVLFISFLIVEYFLCPMRHKLVIFKRRPNSI